MKSLPQFARWLDKQSRFLDELSECEFTWEIGDTHVALCVEAGRYAAHLGCDVVRGQLTAREVLGRYRAWTHSHLPKQELAPREAADKMGVSLRTVRSMLADGRLPHHKIGRQIRIREEDCVFKEKEEKPRKLYRHLDRVA